MHLVAGRHFGSQAGVAAFQGTNSGIRQLEEGVLMKREICEFQAQRAQSRTSRGA